jgi:DNA-binding transcriptional MerR regulator
LLRQIKALLSNGHSCEQAQAALGSWQPDAKPKRSPRRSARQKVKTQALTPAAGITNELAAPTATSEQIIAAKDQQIAELEQILQLALRTNNEHTLALKESTLLSLNICSRQSSAGLSKYHSK